MNGICPCGGILRESTHSVITAEGAEKHGVTGALLPLSVEVTACQACGRREVVLRDALGKRVQK